MEEAGQQGQDRGSSASISTPPLHGGDGSSADNRIDKPRSPKNERMVSNQSEAWNPSRVQTPVNSSNIYTPPEQTYFYGGYDDGLVNWGENSNYLHTNNLQFMPQAIYNDNSSLIYHPAYTFDTQIAYNQFPPLSPIMIDGQLYSPHQLPISPSFYSQPISPTDLSPPQDGLIDNMFLTPQSGYYLHYPTNNNLGFYKYPGEPVSNQPTPVGILGPYEHSFGQQTPYHVGTRMTHQEGVDRDSVESHATTSDRNRGPRASKLKGPGLVTSNDRYNREDFVTSYEKAKFFVIKSFSEDNVHRSIKYGVWASTPLGNRKLDSAFKEAKEDGDTCRIFLFFSVNASGQFCGVAEMIGAVDFENDADYWQQDRWSGQFRVQWHILKDVPNSRFRHILVENNDHKPVTHSRDSQEVKLEEGIAMLKIFKEHDADTSILDDFQFYDEREKSFQEKRSKEQVSSTKTTVDDASINRLSERVADSLHLEKAQGDY